VLPMLLFMPKHHGLIIGVVFSIAFSLLLAFNEDPFAISRFIATGIGYLAAFLLSAI